MTFSKAGFQGHCTHSSHSPRGLETLLGSRIISSFSCLNLVRVESRSNFPCMEQSGAQSLEGAVRATGAEPSGGGAVWGRGLAARANGAPRRGEAKPPRGDARARCGEEAELPDL